MVKPEDRLFKEGDAVDLMCRAEYDKELEIRYFWKRDETIIDYIPNVVEWDVSKNVLTISNIKAKDAGVYTCIAYTPEPIRSEDSASAVINVQGEFDFQFSQYQAQNIKTSCTGVITVQFL